MAKKPVVVQWKGDEVVDSVRATVKRALHTGMGVVKLRATANLGRISRASKWKKPGGFGWWKHGRRHGFLKSSMRVTDYETKDKVPGSAIILSNIVFPVEHGTKRSEAKPFLKPAVRDSASTIRAAIKTGGRR